LFLVTIIVIIIFGTVAKIIQVFSAEPPRHEISQLVSVESATGPVVGAVSVQSTVAGT
jgi:hypothetical protein